MRSIKEGGVLGRFINRLRPFHHSSLLTPNSSLKKSRTPKGMRLFACSHKKGIPKGCSSCAFVSVSDNPSDHCCAASGLFRIQLTGILLRPFSTTKRILYKNGLVKEIYEGNIVTRDGGLGFSDLVIPSAAEGSLLHCGNQRVCTKGKRCLGAASHQAMSTLQ